MKLRTAPLCLVVALAACGHGKWDDDEDEGRSEAHGGWDNWNAPPPPAAECDGGTASTPDGGTTPTPTPPPPPPPPPAMNCPESSDASAVYLNRNPELCTLLEINCPEGQDTFRSDCGCGCVNAAPPPPVCPDPNNPAVLYINEDPAVCAAIEFTCPQRCTRFDSECGCGCLEI